MGGTCRGIAELFCAVFVIINYCVWRIFSLRAGFFMSKLTSRLPNLGYLGREVNSRVNFCRVFFRGKIN